MLVKEIFLIFIFLTGFSFAQNIITEIRQNNLKKVEKMLGEDSSLVHATDAYGSSLLHFAVLGGHLKLSAQLIESGADILATDHEGDRPIHYAALAGQDACIALLLDNGCAVDITNNNGQTPIFYAVRYGFSETVKYLINRNADINKKDNNGQNPLYEAIINEQKEICELLISKKARPPEAKDKVIAMMHSSANMGSQKLFNLLYDEEFKNSRNRKGGSLVHSAVRGGNAGIVEFLLNKNLDVNHRNAFLHQPLYYAHNNDTVRALLLAYHAENDTSRYVDFSKRYFGLESDMIDDTAKILAPNFICKENSVEFAGSFSPDGKEFFFTRRPDYNSGRGQRIWHTIFIDGKWEKPAPAPFTFDTFEYEPHFSSTGDKLFYGSSRPFPGDSVVNRHSPIWVVKKQSGCWGESLPLDTIVNHKKPMYISEAKNGAIYFTNNLEGGIYKSDFINSIYCKPVKLPEQINSIRAAHPYIAPNESYLIYDGSPSDGSIFTGDLYISFRKANGGWTDGLKFGPEINTQYDEMCASVSPDGKLLFFSSNRTGSLDIYYISAHVIDKMRKQVLE